MSGVMEAAEELRKAALSAPARASSAADELWQMYTQLMNTGSHIWHRWYAYAVIVYCVYYMLSARPPVYIIDFAVYEAPKEWQVSRADIMAIMGRLGVFTEDSLGFMGRLLAKSGTGDSTHWPPGTTRVIRDIDPATGEHYSTTDRSIEAARQVAETVLVSVFEEACKRSGKKPRDVDFLIINCSLFCPTPSLCAIVAKKFNLKVSVSSPLPPLRAQFFLYNAFATFLHPCPHHFSTQPTCRTYNLGGMGCSASVISLDLAKSLLEGRPNSIAVIISTEEITQQLYMGNERGHLMQNTLFRVGGAGILLSNKPVDGFRAKYKVLHTIRTQDNSETAHKVVYQCDDGAGIQGIFLGRELVSVAGKVLQANLTALGPTVLPIRELLTFGVTYCRQAVIKWANRLADKYEWERLPFSVGRARAGEGRGGGQDIAQLSPSPVPAPSPPPAASPGGKTTTLSAGSGEANSPALPGRWRVPDLYVPDFKRGVQHFCIHAGGRAVIDGIQENLKLERWRTAPSRATLYHWGNTSSSSVWYELRYCEGENDRVPPSFFSEGVWGGFSTASSSSSSSSSDTSMPHSSSSSTSTTAAPAVTKRGGSRPRSGSAASKKPSSKAVPPAAAPHPSFPPRVVGVNPSDEVDPDAEAAANGWDSNDKWKLPDYRGRQVRRGDRVLQLAFGSGFKCNSSLLLRLR